MPSTFILISLAVKRTGVAAQPKATAVSRAS